MECEMKVSTPSYVVNDYCAACGFCVDVCPTGALTLPVDRAVIDQDVCTRCGGCVAVCGFGAIDTVMPEDSDH